MKGRSTMAPKPSTSTFSSPPPAFPSNLFFPGRSSSAGRQTIMGIALKKGFPESQRSVTLSKTYLSSASKQDNKVNLDKTAQTAFCENIYAYLLEVDFDLTLSVKILKQPSSKLFFAIFNHLLNEIDPNLLSKTPLTEDKFPILIKYIGYPYILPKAVFVALTAPHTWPHLLSLLSWMVDLLKFKKALSSENGRKKLGVK